MRRVLRGLLQFATLMTVAGGAGVAVGTVLVHSSHDGRPATSAADAEPTTGAAGMTDGAAESPVPAPRAAVPATTTAPAAAPANHLMQISVSVLDARLHIDSTPAGRLERRARMTVRVRVANAGTERVALDAPTVRVGSIRVPIDPAADGPVSGFSILGARAVRTTTLRFSVAGDATAKVMRDRRARLLIAGQSVPMRMKVRAPPH